MKFQCLCETLYVPRGLLPKEAVPSPRRACGEQGAEGASTGSARNARSCFTPCSPALDSAVLLEGWTLAAQPFCHFFCMLPPAGSGRSAPSSIFFFFFWRPGVAVEIWRTNEFISYHRWRLLPLAWGLAKLGVAPCPERGGSLCRGKVSGRTCVFPLGCCQVKCSRMRLLVYILCLWTNYICYWKLTYYKGGKRSNTTASWHSSSIRCTICTYLHLFAWILVTMLTSNFLMFFVFLFRRKLLNAACSMFSSVCVRNCLTHNWQPYL